MKEYVDFMCEHCSREEIRITRLPRGHRGTCEWMPESSGDPDLPEACLRKASFLIWERYVEEHLCEEHARREKEDLEGGLRDLLTFAGFDEGELLPVMLESFQRCEHIDLFGGSGAPCGKKAKFARMVEMEYALCQEHAAEYQAKL